MKIEIKRIAENGLFAADVFIVFLILFETRMAIPAWMQSVGRMHPMFLHFPIVILLLAMGMEFFRFRTDLNQQPFYRDFTGFLLLTGALSASVTVIMGLLLSNESSYSGSQVGWHKWMGLAIAAIASFVYWFRDAKWYKASVAKTAAILAVACIVLAGHLGAGITHGEDFISTPLLGLRASEKVPMEKAFIYADVIQPVFKSKCMSCHNSEKAKGRLLLDNEEDILKGGKGGKLFIAGHADSSLIIKRINLPEEEKKHMPLTGKPQLTPDEMELLYRWVQSGADFKKKFIELPENDSLRLIAAKFLAPPSEEKYEFAAADEKTIRSLSNNYRVVAPLAKESPALAVDFYNRQQFSSKALEDLLAVKKQIVTLNLNKMPVADADLKSIGQFENLRVLNLSFTNITGEGLTQLEALKHLRSISVSGTKVSGKTISALSRIKSLKEVFVWNTALTGAEIARLQQDNKEVSFIEGYQNDAAPMQLNAPILVNVNSVFSDTLHVLLKHPIPGIEIRYTLNGSSPDSIHSAIFNNDLVLDKNTIFKARAYKKTWLGSDSIVYSFYKSTYKPDSIRFISYPAESHKGDGAGILSDHLMGGMGFNSDKWLGFQNDMKLMLEFARPVELRSVGLHLLKVVGADIYPPTQVEVWGGMDSAHLKLLKTIRPAPAVKKESPALFLEECKFAATRVSYIKLVARNVKKAPKWGNSPNKPGWIFTDEILLN